jgi:protein involved in polysaccharide export with SLBB domain
MDQKIFRMSDLIQKAGGITEEAYLRGARLTRRLNDEERVRMRATLEAVRSILTESRDSLAMSKMDLDNTYVVGIDLEEALKNPGSDKDLVLREGDALYVPEYNPSVKVSGDVFYPNTVFYEDGKNYKYYVEQSGGFGERAKKKRSFIVYQNGLVGMVKKGAKPEPGCEIIIPSKKKKEHHSVNVTGLIAGATGLSSIAAMIALILNATK